MLNEASVAGAGGVPEGFTVKVAERVTPPPVTEIVTTVWTETKVVITWSAPRVVPAGIVTPVDRNGKTVGLLLVTCKNWSKGAGVAMVTRPSTEPAPPPTTVAGNSVNDVGAGPGATVICVCTMPPFQFAVIVAGVLVGTLPVEMVNGAE